jgi:PIN domain nuclease of toxin-antitoxin system
LSRALLDTHVWLWSTGASQRLGPRTRSLIEDPANDLWLSVASAWELAIKARRGLELGLPVDEYVRSRLRLGRIRQLDIRLDHVLAVAHLPEHHRDPFDRLLISQAVAENLVLVTVDPQIARYDVPVHDATT